MKLLNIAVIGAGHLGRIHAKLLGSVENVRLAAVVDPDASARKRLAVQHGTLAVAHHGELPDEIDAAVVAAPTLLHHQIGMDLLSRGIHIFVEKPLTSSCQHGQELTAQAKRQGVVLQVGHVERFNPALTAVRPFIRRPRYIEASRTSGYSFRSTDIGVVLDLMVHDLDIVLSLVDSQVTAVHAVAETIFGPHEDVAHAWLEFEDGCVATLGASRASQYACRRMVVRCEGLRAEVDFGAPTASIMRVSESIRDPSFAPDGLTAGQKDHVREHLFSKYLPVEKLTIEKRNAILDELVDFTGSIRGSRQPRVSAEDGLKAVSVAERIIRALSTRAAKQSKQLDGLRRPAILQGPHWGARPVAKPAQPRKAG